MHSQVNQNNKDEEQDLREDEGAPHDLEMVVLDLQQEQVALVMPDSESRMSSLIAEKQDKTENLEDQAAALIAREMENAEEHFEDDQISPRFPIIQKPAASMKIPSQ